MAEREHRDPSQEALQKQKKKGRAVWLGLAVAAAVVVLAAVRVAEAVVVGNQIDVNRNKL